MNILVTHSNSPTGCAMRIAAHKTKLDKYIFTDMQDLSDEAIDAIHARVRKDVDTATRILDVNDAAALRRIVREERIGITVDCNEAGASTLVRRIMDDVDGYLFEVKTEQDTIPSFQYIENREYEKI